MVMIPIRLNKKANSRRVSQFLYRFLPLAIASRVVTKKSFSCAIIFLDKETSLTLLSRFSFAGRKPLVRGGWPVRQA
jgi:hypothetical protein